MQHFQPQENLMKNKLINDVGMEIVGYVTPDKTKIKRETTSEHSKIKLTSHYPIHISSLYNVFLTEHTAE